MTFIEYWNEYKKQFKYGVDYIEVDCGDYVAICPSKFKVMKGLHMMCHCLTHDKNLFRQYFDGLVGFTRKGFVDSVKKESDGIKVFFVSKSINLQKSWSNIEEFTGWIYPHSKYTNYLFYLHDAKNYVKSTYRPHILEVKDEYADEYKPFKAIVENNSSRIICEFNKYKEKLRLSAYKEVVNSRVKLSDFKETVYYKTFVESSL
jgi:hypothetical protein